MRDNFSKKIVQALKERASYICSNPTCKVMTIGPSLEDDEKVRYMGRASHISAASVGGPRFNEEMSHEERTSIKNAIFLCSNCSDIIDDNKGLDYDIFTLNKWKSDHEQWVSDNLNKTESKNINVNVSSFNQTGGQVAAVINNYALPGRHLDNNFKNVLNTTFKDTSKKIIISAVSGDKEAYSYAEEIRIYLNSIGFDIKFVGQFTCVPIIIGYRLSKEDGETLHFKIGFM